MPHQVDIHVGKRIRQRRWVTNVTQQQLAEAVGVKFQQIQKYETGANRVSASRLWDIAAVLKVPVSFFFEGLDAPETDSDVVPADFLNNRETQELLRLYYHAPAKTRRKLMDLITSMSDD